MMSEKITKKKIILNRNNYIIYKLNNIIKY